ALVFGDVASVFVHRPKGGSGTNSDPAAAPITKVELPNAAVELSKSNFISAFTTSGIDATRKLFGFQGDFSFDERVVTFVNPPVQKAGLTVGNWNVSGNVLP